MGATETERVMIDWDASDLAACISYAVRRMLIQRALDRARARNAVTVTVADVEAIAAQLEVAAARQGAEVANDGGRKRNASGGQAA
jgi:hypothetical protein